MGCQNIAARDNVHQNKVEHSPLRLFRVSRILVERRVPQDRMGDSRQQPKIREYYKSENKFEGVDSHLRNQLFVVDFSDNDDGSVDTIIMVAKSGNVKGFIAHI